MVCSNIASNGCFATEILFGKPKGAFIGFCFFCGAVIVEIKAESHWLNEWFALVHSPMAFFGCIVLKSGS